MGQSSSLGCQGSSGASGVSDGFTYLTRGFSNLAILQSCNLQTKLLSRLYDTLRLLQLCCILQLTVSLVPDSSPIFAPQSRTALTKLHLFASTPDARHNRLRQHFASTTRNTPRKSQPAESSIVRPRLCLIPRKWCPSLAMDIRDQSHTFTSRLS